MSTDNTLLKVENLRTFFPLKRQLFQRERQYVQAVNGVSLSLDRGKTLGVVGESGCGKSTVGKSILRLVQPSSGQVSIDGVDILRLNRHELRKMRPRMQIVFQDPYSSLNPRLRIGNAIAEPLLVHNRETKTSVKRRVIELMNAVGLDESLINNYPHQFSGGQRQRICIARAIALNPQLIVCDEPASALDVSIQAQILNLLVSLQERFGIAYLFVTHDLSVVSHISHSIAVMYLGKIVEMASAESLFNNPLHPYTQVLLAAIPKINLQQQPEKKIAKKILQGNLPNPINPPRGCYFNTRCPYAEARCFTEEPPLLPRANQHSVACHLVPGG